MDIDISADVKSNPVSRHDPASYLSSSMVTLTVGESNKAYFAHKALFIAYSPYFRGCLENHFAESSTLTINMEDDSESAFECFLSWLYTGTLTSAKSKIECDESDVIILYRLADKLMVVELKNSLVDCWRKWLQTTDRYPKLLVITEISHLGLLDSKLGEFSLRCFACFICERPYLDGSKSDPQGYKSWRYEAAELDQIYEDQELAAEVLKWLVRNQMERWQDPVSMRGCVFHEHECGEPCKING